MAIACIGLAFMMYKLLLEGAACKPCVDAFNGDLCLKVQLSEPGCSGCNAELGQSD